MLRRFRRVLIFSLNNNNSSGRDAIFFLLYQVYNTILVLHHTAVTSAVRFVLYLRVFFRRRHLSNTQKGYKNVVSVLEACCLIGHAPTTVHIFVFFLLLFFFFLRRLGHKFHASAGVQHSSKDAIFSAAAGIHDSLYFSFLPNRVFSIL